MHKVTSVTDFRGMGSPVKAKMGKVCFASLAKPSYENNYKEVAI